MIYFSTYFSSFFFFFFFNDTATTEIYTLSLHDALPILPLRCRSRAGARRSSRRLRPHQERTRPLPGRWPSIDPVASFDTKIAVLLRDDLEGWQRLNVCAFLI